MNNQHIPNLNSTRCSLKKKKKIQHGGTTWHSIYLSIMANLIASIFSMPFQWFIFSLTLIISFSKIINTCLWYADCRFDFQRIACSWRLMFILYDITQQLSFHFRLAWIYLLKYEHDTVIATCLKIKCYPFCFCFCFFVFFFFFERK